MLVLAGAVLVAPPAAAQTAALRVTPGTTSPGRTLTISGSVPSGGTASCPVEDAAILTSDAGFFPPDGVGPQLSRDATGGFQTSYTVPTATPPGSHRISVRCGGGNVGVSATVQVTRQASGDDSGGGRLGLVAGTVAALVAALALAVVVRRRRR